MTDTFIEKNGKFYRQSKRRLYKLYRHICKNCNSEFYSNNTKQMFCSLVCNYDFKNKTNAVICPFCGNEFIKANKSIIFCCKEHYFRSANKHETSIEKKLYKYLEDNDIKFEKQKKIERCFPDAFVKDLNLCIFADGAYWHNSTTVKERDNRITSRLIKAGYSVIRLRETSKRHLDLSELIQYLDMKG